MGVAARGGAGARGARDAAAARAARRRRGRRGADAPRAALARAARRRLRRRSRARRTAAAARRAAGCGSAGALDGARRQRRERRGGGAPAPASSREAARAARLLDLGRGRAWPPSRPTAHLSCAAADAVDSCCCWCATARVPWAGSRSMAEQAARAARRWLERLRMSEPRASSLERVTRVRGRPGRDAGVRRRRASSWRSRSMEGIDGAAVAALAASLVARLGRTADGAPAARRRRSCTCRPSGARCWPSRPATTCCWWPWPSADANVGLARLELRQRGGAARPDAGHRAVGGGAAAALPRRVGARGSRCS